MKTDALSAPSGESLHGISEKREFYLIDGGHPSWAGDGRNLCAAVRGAALSGWVQAGRIGYCLGRRSSGVPERVDSSRW
jgi:hypothetical protein